MKILFIINSMMHRSGSERVVALLSNMLCDDYVIHILVRGSSQCGFEIDPRVKVISGPKHVVRFGLFSRRKIIESEYDCVIVHTMNLLGLYFCFLTLFTKVKIFSYEHVSYQSNPFLVKILKKIFYKKLNGVICINDKDASSYKSMGLMAVKINNPLAFDINKDVDFNNKFGNKKIISLGRLAKQKGYDMLIKAWAKVEGKHSDWQLDIYGDGEEKNSLERLIFELGCKKVNINAAVLHPESVYASASFYIMSSRYEGFGLVLIEAQSFGLPIVSFDCPNGPSEIISDKSGILVEAGNIDLLTSAIIKMIEKNDFREKCRVHSFENAKKYTSSNVKNMWVQFLKHM